MSTSAEVTPIPIKELLIEATFAQNRALRPGVKVIDLGILGEEAERIQDRSSQLPVGSRIEFAIPALVSNTKKLLLRREEISGTIGSAEAGIGVNLRPNYENLSKIERQELFIATHIHNLIYPLPPSPNDFRKFFAEDSHPYSETCVFISNPLEKIVIFRGENTPGWGVDDLLAKVEKWNRNLKIYRFRAITTSLTASLDEQERKAQMEFLMDLVKRYDILAFSCPLKENIARRMTF